MKQGTKLTLQVGVKKIEFNVYSTSNVNGVIHHFLECESNSALRGFYSENFIKENSI